MTGRQKIEAALSDDGTPEVPAAICYEGIYFRDHWDQVTSHPWWYQFDSDIEHQLLWYRDTINRTGQDWFVLPYCYSRKERLAWGIVEKDGGVFWVNKPDGEYTELRRPRVAGWSESGGLHSYHPSHLPETYDGIDKLIRISDSFDPSDSIKDGRNDLALVLLEEFGSKYPIHHVSSPLWQTYSIWGFEGMMTMIADKPSLVEYACQRYLKLGIQSVYRSAMLGAAGIWIEECLTDMISSKAFERLNVFYLRQLVEEIRKAGLKSIYYFCGNPKGKWEQIFSVGADAVSLEESKKGFVIDIEDVVEKAKGRCAILGNLDAINLLPNATEDQLKDEISRQISAGQKNNGRFIMSIGSPVTPETPVERVRLYCDLVHELGNIKSC